MKKINFMIKEQRSRWENFDIKGKKGTVLKLRGKRFVFERCVIKKCKKIIVKRLSGVFRGRKHSKYFLADLCFVFNR